MASLNINNHIKSSLEFVHRGTVVFLRYFGPFSNQRPFPSLHTRVCNRTGLCLQQRPHREVRSPTKTTFSHVKKNSGVVLPSFPQVLERRNVASFISRFQLHGLLCAVFFWRQRPVLLLTRVRRLGNGLWFENEPKYLRNTTVPRWTKSKQHLI